MKYLEEIWGVYPVNLDHVDTLEDTKLYSSQKLVEKILTVLEEKIPEISSSVSVLLKNQIILPVFVSGNAISFFFHKLFAEPINKSILGFFSSEKNRIYLLLDNNINLVSWSPDERLAELLIHECMHYSMYNYKKDTFKIFGDSLVDYYSNFFSRFFSDGSSTPSKRPVLEFIHFLIEILETNKELSSWKDIPSNKYFEKLKKIGNSMEGVPEDIVEERSNYILKELKIFINDPNLFIKRTRNEKNTELVVDLLVSYESIGINYKDLETLAIQELLAPSEIIAMSTIKLNNKHFRIVNNLAKKVE